jgi:predicted nicotinamide N-methyase
MKLDISETESSQRSVLAGAAVVVRTQITVCKPAEIEYQALVDEVKARAQQTDCGWEIVDHPVLGDFTVGHETVDDLVADVAAWLNEQGVSVRGGGPYWLGNDE